MMQTDGSCFSFYVLLGGRLTLPLTVSIEGWGRAYFSVDPITGRCQSAAAFPLPSLPQRCIIQSHVINGDNVFALHSVCTN